MQEQNKAFDHIATTHLTGHVEQVTENTIQNKESGHTATEQSMMILIKKFLRPRLSLIPSLSPALAYLTFDLSEREVGERSKVKYEGGGERLGMRLIHATGNSVDLS